eukprot:3107174-Rhodomonas_salina.5
MGMCSRDAATRLTVEYEEAGFHDLLAVERVESTDLGTRPAYALPTGCPELRMVPSGYLPMYCEFRAAGFEACGGAILKHHGEPSAMDLRACYAVPGTSMHCLILAYSTMLRAW